MKLEAATCRTCGYTWLKGQDGSHSCSGHLSARVRELQDGIRRIIEVRLDGYTDNQYGKGELRALLSSRGKLCLLKSKVKTSS